MMRLLQLSALVMASTISVAAQGPPPRDSRPEARDKPDAGTILGMVLSDTPDARPLRNARVSLRGGGGPVRMVATGDDGTFVFTGLQPGRYTVAAVKEPYVLMAFGAKSPNHAGTPVDVRSGGIEEIMIRLPPGAVITGTIVDADGQPLAGVMVQAARLGFNPNTGERQVRILTGGPGQVTSDDRGVYRIFGLPAGEYIVAATPPPSGAFPNLLQLSSDDVRRALAEVRSAGGPPGTRSSPGGRRVTGVPVYYPGESSPARATRVSVRPGDERAGVDIQLQYVPAATVSGVVANVAAGTHTAVSLIPIDRPLQDRNYNSHPDGEGRFVFRNVEPGAYMVLARGGPTSRTAEVSTMHWAAAEIEVDGQDVTGVVLTVQPTLTLAGRLEFQGSPPAPGTLPRTFRMPMPVLYAGRVASPAPPIEILDGGRFRIDALVPGPYRPLSALPGVRSPIGRWWLTSVMAQGRELLDAPLEFRQNIDDAVATFTERASELKGTVTGSNGTAGEAWVIAFSGNPEHWFPHSRRVAAVRSGLDGQYSIRNLPAGEYLVVSGDGLEAGEWFDRAVLERLAVTAQRFVLGDGESKALDVRGPQ